MYFIKFSTTSVQLLHAERAPRPHHPTPALWTVEFIPFVVKVHIFVYHSIHSFSLN
jgi:hypothetical protein